MFVGQGKKHSVCLILSPDFLQAESKRNDSPRDSLLSAIRAKPQLKRLDAEGTGDGANARTSLLDALRSPDSKRGLRQVTAEERESASSPTRGKSFKKVCVVSCLRPTQIQKHNLIPQTNSFPGKLDRRSQVAYAEDELSHNNPRPSHGRKTRGS